MKRLVVCDSALVHPGVPEAVLRDGDVVLPLVERFDEAVFMAGPGYDQLRERFPEFNLESQRIAREISAVLPDWLADSRPGWGHSAWNLSADLFVKFSLGPLLANLELARRATEAAPEEVLAWELHGSDGWWSRRQMVAEIAAVIADAAGAPLELSAPWWKRRARALTAPTVPVAQALRFLGRAGRAGREEVPGTADVVFAVFGPTLIPLYDRIAGRIQEDHGLRCLAIDIPPGDPGEPMEEGELPRVSIHSFCEPDMVRQARREVLTAWRAGARAARRLAEVGPLSDLPPAALKLLGSRLRTTLTRDVTACIHYARLWERVLGRLKSAALVAFNTYGGALAAGVLQARHRTIPTICVQHGIWGPYFQTGALLPYDDVLVFGPYAREVLQPLAAPHTRFTTTGHCLYDDVSEGEAAEPLRSELLGEHDRLVLVTTQPIEGRLRRTEPRWWLEGAAQACEELNALLVIKPHPHERDLARYRPLLRRHRRAARLIRHGELPLLRLIAAADVLITRFSTTALEAALLRTPVLTVNLSGGPDQYPYAEEGAALGVWEYDDILPTLRSVLVEPEARQRSLQDQECFLDRHLGLRDGGATQRIADFIAERLREGRDHDREETEP
ncbi:MAG: hypothetical protein U9R79_18360 [Armatimonadota bacterium]|nr:hypothetical protein [Armatimonadota bacterium]